MKINFNEYREGGDTSNANMGSVSQSGLMENLFKGGSSSGQQTVTTEPANNEGTPSQQSVVTPDGSSTPSVEGQQNPNSNESQNQGGDNGTDNNPNQNATTNNGSSNNDGNANNSDGNQDGSEDINSEETSEISAVLGALGMEQNEETPYTNDTEGLTRAVQDKYKTDLPNLVNQELQRLFSVNEQTQQLFEHLSEGNSVDSFIQERAQQDFQSYDISVEDGQKGLIRSHFTELGLGDAEINAIIKTKVNDGSLKDFSKGIYDNKMQAHQQVVEATKAEERAQKIQQQQEAQQINAEINDILNSGKLVDYQLPVNEVSEFKNFIYGKDEQGVSATSKAYNQATREQKLLIDYLLFKGFKLSGATARANNQSLKFGDKSSNNAQSSGNPRVMTTPRGSENKGFAFDFRSVKTGGKPE